LAAAQAGAPTGIFNAADGAPTSIGAYYRELANLLGVAPPPEIDRARAEREWSATRLSFLRESRRLDNTRLTRELGVRLRYPSYREGLAASL
jgi:nucleoside-diphosphate-sugar epimerase